MSRRKKRLKMATFAGSSKLTIIKRARIRIGTSFLCYPLIFSKSPIFNTSSRC